MSFIKKPGGWKNLPSHDTAIDADSLNDLETRISDSDADNASETALVARRGSPTTWRLEIAGDSWAVSPTLPEWGWPEKLRRMLAAETARTGRYGVNGATALNSSGFVDMNLRVLQGTMVAGPAHEHYLGNPAIVGDWPVPSGIVVVTLGFNDAIQHPSAVLPIKSALRSLISRMRACRVFESDNAGVVSLGAGWASLVTTSQNSGANFAYTSTAGSEITITVPADYDGRPISIGYVSNGSSALKCTLEAKVGSVVYGTWDLRAEEAQRLAVSGTNTRAFCGCVRMVLPVTGAVQSLKVKALSIDAGGIATFDHVTFEGDPLVLLVLKPNLPTGYDPAGTGNPAINLSNQWNRDVAAEFTDGRVVVVEPRSEFSQGGCWVAPGDPHLSYSGHAVMTASILDAISDQKQSNLKRAGR